MTKEELFTEENEVKFTITDINQLIHNKELDYDIIKNNIDNITETIKSIEDNIIVEIEDEKDENNKSKYSNDLKRRVELKNRLDKNEIYKTLTEDLKSIKNILSQLKHEIDFLKRSFSIEIKNITNNNDIVEAIKSVSSAINSRGI